MKIEFKVRGQTLIRADNKSVAGNSYGFLRAGFDFGDDWAGLIKVACFTTSGGSAYDVTLGTGQTCECEVANEALAASATQGGFFYVSVRGVDAVSDATVRGTVNRVRVDLEASGAMQGGNSVPATPSETEQILAYLAKGTWLDGVAVSGTGTGIEVTTAIEGAAPGVWYINTANGNLYKCSAVTGTSSTWDYVMTLKGEPGDPGEQGEPGEPLRTVNNASAIDSWIASPGAPVTYALCMADVSSPSKGYDFAKGDVLKYTLSSQTLAVAYSIVGPRGVDGQDGVDGESIVSFNTTDAIDTYIASYAFPRFFFVWGGTEATEYEFTKADGTSGRKSLSIGDVFGVTINTEVHKIVSFDGTKGNIRGAKGNTGNTGAAGADGADGKPGSPVPFTDTSAAKTYLANNLGSSQTILILNASEANMLFLTYTVAPNEVWAVANDADHTGWRNATFTKRGSIIGTNGADGKNAYPMTSVSSTSDITAIQTALSSGTYASSDAYAWVSVAFSTYVKGDLLHITTSAVTVTYHYDTYDIGIDDEPTEGSQNLVRSGGVWAMIQSAITDAIGGSY